MIYRPFYKWLVDTTKEKIDATCKWRITLYENNQPIWATEKKQKIWIALFRGEKLMRVGDWWSPSQRALNHVFRFTALKGAQIHKAKIELRSGKRTIYSRTWNFGTLYMDINDNLDLAFEITLT